MTAACKVTHCNNSYFVTDFRRENFPLGRTSLFSWTNFPYITFIQQRKSLLGNKNLVCHRESKWQTTRQNLPTYTWKKTAQRSLAAGNQTQGDPRNNAQDLSCTLLLCNSVKSPPQISNTTRHILGLTCKGPSPEGKGHTRSRAGAALTLQCSKKKDEPQI